MIDSQDSIAKLHTNYISSTNKLDKSSDSYLLGQILSGVELEYIYNIMFGRLLRILSTKEK